MVVVVAGLPVAGAGRVVDMMMVAAGQHLHLTDVLGYSEGEMACGCWSCDCYYRNRNGPDDC